MEARFGDLEVVDWSSSSNGYCSTLCFFLLWSHHFSVCGLFSWWFDYTALRFVSATLIVESCLQRGDRLARIFASSPDFNHSCYLFFTCCCFFSFARQLTLMSPRSFFVVCPLVCLFSLTSPLTREECDCFAFFLLLAPFSPATPTIILGRGARRSTRGGSVATFCVRRLTNSREDERRGRRSFCISNSTVDFAMFPSFSIGSLRTHLRARKPR